MTNFKRIRNMTVEQLAERLQDGINECDVCIYGEDYICPNTCLYGISKWLETEAQENDRQ